MKRKGFTEGIKIIAAILLVVAIVLILIVLTQKFLIHTDTKGTGIIEHSSNCISNLLNGDKCN